MARNSRRRRVRLNGLNELEAEIMQIVWRRGRTTVRDVHEELLVKGYTPYTTVMAAMNNLAQKDVLKQDKKDRAYSYKAAISSIDMANDIVDNVIERILSGSASPVISHLLKLKNEEEVAELLELRNKLQS